MAIVRWDPWKELAGFERQFDELFGRMGRTRSAGGNPWAPALDVHQEGDTMVICADVAGVDPGKIDITVDDNVLTISGQRAIGAEQERARILSWGKWVVDQLDSAAKATDPSVRVLMEEIGRAHV